MKMFLWNILHGGGPQRTPAIALAILAHQPDLVVLTEFRLTTGGQLAGVLHDHGFTHQCHSNPPPKCNGVFIASRSPLTGVHTPDPARFHHKLITALMPDFGLRIAAAHVPDAKAYDTHAMARKSLFWKELLIIANRWKSESAMLVGDLNTGRPGIDEDAFTLTSAAMLGKLSAIGYSDAYRHLHPRGSARSWYSHTGSGFRLDHALCSAPLTPKITASGYSQSERVEGLSDHAPMVIELSFDRVSSTVP